MMGPVEFRVGDRWVQPYAIAPWANEPGIESLPPILQALRGDFFCMPFGETGQDGVPIHGKCANEVWTLRSKSPSHVSLTYGNLTRQISVIGASSILQRWTIAENTGRTTLGNHAMLQIPESGGRVSVGSLKIGQVVPGDFEVPYAGGYSSLEPGEVFDQLDHVRRRDGSFADATKLPLDPGFENLLMIGSEPATQLGWTAVCFPQAGYVWISIKNTSVLPCTLFWHSNGGRHYWPWSGRHRNVLGVEDLCSYFNLGPQTSEDPNPFTEVGIPTYLEVRDSLDVKSLQTVLFCSDSDGLVEDVFIDSTHFNVVFQSGRSIGVDIDVASLLTFSD
jgi:hypothetical protein